MKDLRATNHFTFYEVCRKFMEHKSFETNYFSFIYYFYHWALKPQVLRALFFFLRKMRIGIGLEKY